MAQGLGLDWGSEGMGKKDIQTHTEPSSGRLCLLSDGETKAPWKLGMFLIYS